MVVEEAATAAAVVGGGAFTRLLGKVAPTEWLLCEQVQRTKKVVSDSLGLVKFAVGLPGGFGQAKFLRKGFHEIQITEVL